MSILQNKSFLLWLILLTLLIFAIFPLRGQTYHFEKQEDNYKLIEIYDKINPNTADWPSLARLPSIGEKRAKDIINYRNNSRLYDNTTTVYTNYLDLAQVRGIGEITCENIKDYLTF